MITRVVSEIEVSDVPSQVAMAAKTDGEIPPQTEEGCPTPLAWQEVRESVRSSGIRHQVEHQGVQLSATSFGEGRPLYLLPGFFGDHELFVLTSWLLREECCCVMADPPQSDNRRHRSPAQTLREWTGSVLHLADELGHDRMSLYGPGFGGLMVIQALLDVPDRIETAIIQSGFARYRQSLTERLVTSVAGRLQRTAGEVTTAMRIQQQNHRGWFPPFDTTRWDFYAENVAATSVAQIARRAQVASGVDFRATLNTIRTPVLLVATEGDGPVSERAQSELAGGLSNSRQEAIDNCGQLPYVTHPHRLVKLLRAFWEETS